MDTGTLSRISEEVVPGAAVAWAVVVAALLAGCSGNPGPRSLAAGLQSESPSERIQACIVAAGQRDPQALPLLVERLADSSADVRLFAITALKKMTGQSLGYRYYAPPTERAEAVRRWREWLKARRRAGEEG